MMLVNIFKGAKTGKLQIELAESGFPSKILIPGEDLLTFVKTEER